MAAVGFALAAVGCGGGGGTAVTTPVTLSFSLGSTTVVVPQDGATVQVPVSVTGPSGTPVVTISGLPAGVMMQYTSVSGSLSGTLIFTGSTSAVAGSYTPTLTVSLAGQTSSQSFTLVSAVVAKVTNVTDTSLGVKGVLKQFMATSFQIAEWSPDLFGTGTTTTAQEAELTTLKAQHIRLQALSTAIPMKANIGLPSDWDFTLLDKTVQPVLASADHSPEFQIAAAPTWMCDSSGHLDMTNHLQDFAAYAANLVRYYNKGGFNLAGVHFQSASSQPITWWGVFNEYNINGLTTAQYITLYNTVVPAMQAIDSTIKFSALEFSDYGLGTGEAGDLTLALPTFVAAANAGGVKAQVDVVSTHLYGTCNQLDTDATIFSAVPDFVANVNYFYRELQTRSDLASVPLWVTENNVNADSNNNGMSNCYPTRAYVIDPRGTSAFFAAWRPYVFSQLGKAGNQALYQWSYTGDKQYGEVDSSGNPYLGYWVDRTLATLYPSTATSPGPSILSVNSTDTSSVETLATQGSDGKVVVMVVDRAVHTSNDNNGSGDPRTVVVDLSSFSSFYAASLTTINSATSVSAGPTGAGVTPSTRMTVTLPGYGVAFLTLTP
ncbi:MAG: hypothetical protein P4K86_11870 [Terracidiphilus sp.]|nr:hypothetical protein [Terracidiphilus sp.]